MAKKNPFELRESVRGPRFKAIDAKGLARRATKLSEDKVAPVEDLVMELTPRKPWESAKRQMDVLWPGRYDTESDLVFMHPIVTGPSPGEWDGTVVYARFDAPSTGTYLVVANFTGHQITGHLHGPWGEQTAFSGTTSDAAAVVAIWKGSGGVSFTFNCTGSIMGYLKSIQVYKLS
jgi:hypothetical protein